MVDSVLLLPLLIIGAVLSGVAFVRHFGFRSKVVRLTFVVGAVSTIALMIVVIYSAPQTAFTCRGVLPVTCAS